MKITLFFTLVCAIASPLQGGWKGAAEAATVSAKECRRMGFTKALQCRSCEKLEKEVGKARELIEECRQCCSDDDGDTVEKYAVARLEVCD